MRMARYCSYVACALVAFVLASMPATVSASEMINNGDFETLSETDIMPDLGGIWDPSRGDETDAWYGWNPYWQLADSGYDGSSKAACRAAGNTGTYGMIYIFSDDGADGHQYTGEHTMSFALTGRWSGGLYVLGYESIPSFMLDRLPAGDRTGLILNPTPTTYYGLSRTATEWQEEQVLLDFGEGHNYIFIGFYTSLQDEIIPPMLDNVSITPEPTMLSLLGLGGLLALRRRRR